MLTSAYSNYSYDPQGNRLTKVTNDGTTSYEYSLANELKSTSVYDPATQQTSQQATYTYDANGNTIKKTMSTVHGPSTMDYFYDNKNQLVKVVKSNGDTVEYIYDGNGNRYKKSVITRSPEGDVVISDRYYSYDTGGNIVSEYERPMPNVGDRSWHNGDSATNWDWQESGTPSVDAATKYEGSASIKFQKAETSLTWNRIWNSSLPTIDLSGSGNKITFRLYIADQDTLDKIAGGDWIDIGTDSSNGRDFRWYSTGLVVGWNLITVDWDDYNSEYGTLDQANIKRFAFGLDVVGGASTTIDEGKILIDDIKYKNSNPVTNDEPRVLVRYVRDNSAKAISMIQGANTYYFVYNGHGDVTSLTDSSGAVVATYSYDEFGNQTSSTGNIYNPLRYSGANNAYYDTETSLYKMGARYYQPDVGRWLTRDSYKGEQASPQSQNRYVYVDNNPVAYFDSTGFNKQHCKSTTVHGSFGNWATKEQKMHFLLFGGAALIISGGALGVAYLGPAGIGVIGYGSLTTGYRYVDQAEALIVRNTGKIPNTYAQRGGQKLIFYTNQAVKSASRAQRLFELPKKPQYRVEFDLTKVRPGHGGLTSHNGAQFTTSQQIGNIKKIRKLWP